MEGGLATAGFPKGQGMDGWARLGSCFRWLPSSVQASQGQGRRLLHPCWLPQRPQIPPNPRWSLNLSGLGLRQAGAGRPAGGQ